MNKDQRFQAGFPRQMQLRHREARLLALSGAVVAAAFLIAGVAAAQQAPPASQVERQQSPAALSPATIRMLQHSLMQGGYAIDAADGVWGPKTIAAVREFQRVKGLEPTGRADRQTLAALGVSADGSGPRTAAGSGAEKLPPVRTRTLADLDRATIRAVQQALNKQGLKVGPADGVWGEQTASAIGNFQRTRGMPASGQLDAHTLAALGFLPGSERVVAARGGQMPGPSDLDPAAIRMIQQSLNQHGFEVGSPDGIWGDRTISALRDFQRTRGIEPLGEPDVHTLAALGLLPGKAARR